MKKLFRTAVLASAVAGASIAPANAAPNPTSGGSNDGVAVALIIAVGIMIFGGGLVGTASTKQTTTKSADSQF